VESAGDAAAAVPDILLISRKTPVFVIGMGVFLKINAERFGNDLRGCWCAGRGCAGE
jgi:hypothetical protein